MAESAESAAALTCGSVVFWSIASIRFCASWSPRPFSVSIAASRSAERRVIAGRDDRGDGELQRVGDARIAFLGELGLDRGQRLGVAALEHVFGRGEALLGIGIGEGQRADRAFDGAAQRVVDAHFLERGGVGDRRAGLCVDDFSVGGRDRRRRGCAGSNSRRLSPSASRIAAPCGGASAASSPIAFSLSANLSVEEPRERVVEGVRPRRAGKSEAAEKREDGQRERERALANGEMQSGLMLARFGGDPPAQAERAGGTF